MGEVVNIVLGLILGAILMYWVYSLFRKKKNKEITEHQSTVILNKIRSVCKLVSVEGDFAEIYHYENTKDSFMSLFRSKKGIDRDQGEGPYRIRPEQTRYESG